MLLTKLHRPPLSLEHVFRFRLIDELNKNMYKPLSLVCAPAGYGKSMLVSSWIEENKHPTAWLSLSSDEDDYRTFLISMVTAIQKVFPGKLEKTEALVKAPELPSNKLMAHSFINELDQIRDNYIVVLDDYHLIYNEAIHQLIDELLRYPPENLHLCMLTRRDPPIRIQNLRVHTRMIEIRMGELTFTEEEVIGLFYKLHGIKLKRSLAASLKKKTEGWITALQLISLASKRKPNIENELSSFTGDLNTLSDFLIEEILSGLSENMKELLFSTALLNSFCLKLVKACFEPKKDDNSDLLRTETLFDLLINSNFFLIPLDNERKWFRYHHLFQKTLVKHLGSGFDAESIKRVHYLAAKWFEDEGLIEEALDHMVKSGKVEEAARIIEINAHNEFLKNVGIVEIWLNKLPLVVKESSPGLQMINAWLAFGEFHLEKIPPILEKVNKLIQDTIPDPQLSSELSFFRGNFQYWTGDTEGSIQSFEQSMNQCDHLPDHIKCNIELLRYVALQRKGHFDTIVIDLKSRINNSNKYSSIDIGYYWGSLTFVHLLSGQLRSTLDTAVQMQMFTEKIGATFLINWSFYLQALANFQLFQLEKAYDHFAVISDKHYILDTMAVFDSKVSLALIHQLNGKSKEANKLIAIAIDYAKEIGDPLSLLLVQSAQSRIALLQGDIQSAFQWIDTFNEPPSFAGMFFWQEIPHMTKAKVLIAKGTPECLQKAEEILITMLDIATSSNLHCQMVEINLLLSLALKKMEEEEALMEKLKASVILAEEYGFIRPFVEAGKSAMVLLNSLKEKGVALDFIDEIDHIIAKIAGKQETALHENIEVSEKVVLTERELETLELLASGLRNKEIANALFVSEGTIKKHVYNMGQKFETRSRVDLLNRARQLGLI
ncbi:MAG: hypothetical protein KC454_11450 [Flavobacteriales bacterium]|nr:hypothetical protein [Flavobacteriales bacterium]